MRELIPKEVIEQKIFLLRGQKVMVSIHIAELYGVKPKVLIQTVKRNIERFPKDFMFQLTGSEFQILKSHFVTSSYGGIRRAMPYAFTEQGVAMLSGILNSKRAIRVNIAIMRAFVRLRRILLENRVIAEKLIDLEKKYEKHEGDISTIFNAIRQLMLPLQKKTNKRIGFRVN